MKLMRGAALVGIARTVYSQARKPQNQARARRVIDKVRRTHRSSR